MVLNSTAILMEAHINASYVKLKTLVFSSSKNFNITDWSEMPICFEDQLECSWDQEDYSVENAIYRTNSSLDLVSLYRRRIHGNISI
jgi:hypothetical protein